MHFRHGAAVEPSWNQVEPSWNQGGTEAEPRRNQARMRDSMAPGNAFSPRRRGGAEVEPSGTEVEPSWNPGGTKPALKILETLPARHARPAF